MNGDGTVDVADIVCVIEAMAITAKPHGDNSPNPVDVNGDGAIDVADISTLISILTKLARLHSNLPVVPL